MAPPLPPSAKLNNQKGFTVIPLGSNTPTFDVDRNGNGYFAGTLRIDGELQLQGGGTAGTTLGNNEFLAGLTTASVVKRLIGVNASNLVSIDADAAGVTMAGTLAVTGAAAFSSTISGTAITGSVSVSGVALLATTIQARTSTLTVLDPLLFTDNAVTLGDATHRASIGYFGTALAIGTSPASSGALRLANAGNLNWFNSSATNTIGITLDGSNVLRMGDAGSIYASGMLIESANFIKVNSAQQDSDFIVYTDTATGITVDSGLFSGVGAVGVGSTADTRAFVSFDPTALTIPTNTSYSRLRSFSSAAVTVPAGTAPVVSTLYLKEPNITATGTVTLGATLYIEDAPTEGATNAALYVAAGMTFLAGGATSISFVTTLTDRAGAQVATMTNGPTAGNPTKWFDINDAGVTRRIPAW